jgi:hypothetical protein
MKQRKGATTKYRRGRGRSRSSSRNRLAKVDFKEDDIIVGGRCRFDTELTHVLQLTTQRTQTSLKGTRERERHTNNERRGGKKEMREITEQEQNEDEKKAKKEENEERKRVHNARVVPSQKTFYSRLLLVHVS